MQDFKNKIAVVTGAASGIGFELCQLFAEQGMHIVLADIEPQALAKAEQRIAALGVDTLSRVTDVGDAEAVEALAQQAQDHFGAIHIACNNAGVFTGGQCWENTLDDYAWLMRVNQWGVIHGIRSFVPRMLAQGGPCHLVNTASMAAVTTMPYSGIYHMTKHAVLALSECLHHELALSGAALKVSCLCPELVNTAIASGERNRPASLADANRGASWQLTNEAIVAGTAQGLSPRVLAERTLTAIREQRFYIFPPTDDPWSVSARSRLEDIRLERNPTLAPPL